MSPSGHHPIEFSEEPGEILRPLLSSPKCPPGAPATPDGRKVGEIVLQFLKHWSTETTVEQNRAPLEVETQRQGSDLAIERITPCRLGLYWIAARWTHRLYLDGHLVVRREAWYAKERVTFGDALASLRHDRWETEYFSTSSSNPEWVEIPRVYLKPLMQSACDTH